MSTTPKSLEDLIKQAGNPVDMLRNSPTGPNVYPVVPPEYTNWRDEQRAWQETCVLFNQSYHMTDMYSRGQGRAEAHLEISASTASRGSSRTRRSSSCPCNYDGYVIGDVILYYLEPGAVQPHRPPVGAQLGAVPCGDRRLRRHAASVTSATVERTGSTGSRGRIASRSRARTP